MSEGMLDFFKNKCYNIHYTHEPYTKSFAQKFLCLGKMWIII
jgi:hypothetical protein